jgi:3-hydroxyacyl-[acyl-carrier-protein] dehydratase
MLEGMAQTAGVLCIRAIPGEIKPTLVYFLTIDKAKFRKPVIPGDRIEYHMTRLKRRKNMWWFRGEAKVDGQVVAEAELGAMIAEA